MYLFVILLSCWFMHSVHASTRDLQQFIAHIKQKSTATPKLNLPHIPQIDTHASLDATNTAKPQPLIRPQNRLAQIKIAAQILNIDQRYMRDIGILFATSQSHADDSGLTTDLPNIDSGLGHVIFSIAHLNNNASLNVEIAALEEQGHAKLIASPQLITLNNKSASIESGEEIPYQERAYGGNTSVTFKKAVLRLRVTPKIIDPHHILLTINVNQDKVGRLTINGVPAIRTQQLHTIAIARPNSTVVLGGIFEKNNTQQSWGIPGLDRIPLLGKLFMQKHQLLDRKMLLIFVTPSLITDHMT